MGMYGIDEMFRVRFGREEIEELRNTLSEMRNPVDVYTFVDERCRYCSNTVKLVEVLSDASPAINESKLIKHTVVSRGNDALGLFKKFNVSRVPAVAFLDGYIRYTGMPAGEEIRGFIETLIRLSTGDSGLSQSAVETLSKLKGSVRVEVIVTPTCPYCPYAALLANMFAFESYRLGNKVVIADVVEAYENPDIADMYGVMTVPTIAINGEVEFVGVPYEDQLLEKVVEHSNKAYLKQKKKEEYMKLLKELEKDTTHDKGVK